jgi:hypothetical protein
LTERKQRSPSSHLFPNLLGKNEFKNDVSVVNAQIPNTSATQNNKGSGMSPSRRSVTGTIDTNGNNYYEFEDDEEDETPMGYKKNGPGGRKKKKKRRTKSTKIKITAKVGS